MIIRRILDWILQRYLVPFTALSVGLAVLLSFAHFSAGSAQSGEQPLRWVQTFEAAATGLSHPAGLAFSPKSNSFLILEAAGIAPPAETNIVRLTPLGERRGSARLAAALHDPINLAFDQRTARLLLLQSPGQLLAVPQDPQGELDGSALVRYNVRRFGLQDPQGMSVDPASGALYILDAAGPKIVRVRPGANGGFDQAAISSVSLEGMGLKEARGLAFDPSTGHLQILNPAEQKLVEISQAGQLVAERSLADSGSDFVLIHPEGMVFAPSGDQTDDPSALSLYIADEGAFSVQTTSLKSGSANLQPGGMEPSSQNSGQVLEFSFSALPAASTTTFVSDLVRLDDLAALNPPSPDPSGIAYIPTLNNLVMSDGEVEETVSGITHFEGANVWDLTLDATIVYTANISKIAPTVVPMTNEPTGTAWNPGNGHYYFSDDGKKMVFDLDPGADGRIGTTDDTWTSFDTSAAGSGDPEGITFDSWNNRIFVADGVNMEVYEFTTAGSLVNHFDVEQYGIADPESVEFNAQSGTLFVLSSRRFAPIAVETDLSGNLLETIDISSAGSRKAAGLAYGPASDGSGAMRFYIVDRGIDNNTDPNIIDGKMYEMTAPSSGNQAPAATDDSYSVNEDTVLNVAAPGVLSNDNDPDGDPLAAVLDTSPSHGTISLSADGSFTYTPEANFNGADGFKYHANDGSANSNTATVGITVNAVNDPPVAVDDSYNAVENTQLTVSVPGVLGNDSDVDGDPLTAVLDAGPNHGTLTLSADGSFSYTPAANFTGMDSFTYHANDGTANSNVATVSLTVNAVNNPPTAVGDAYTTNEDTPLNVPSPGILSNDSDPDGDTLTAVLDTGPAHGTLTLNTDGSFSYTPNANYNGADNFTYYANDGTANSNIAAVSLTINPVNDPPVAVDDSYSASEGTPFSVAAPGVLGNDSDVDGDALTAVLDTSTTHGTLSLNADGSFTYNPEANFTGSDSFSYHASDGTANSNVASVTISVSGSPSTLSFLPSDDAYVRSDDSSGNYGSDVALDVREHKRQAAHSYLKFNVSGISGSVSSVKLRLFSTVGTNSNISIYAVSNNYGNSSTPWAEQGLTWNNAPGASGSPIATINSVSSGSWVEFDLTQAVISDGVYSFELVNDAPNWAIFNSKEASDNPPELVITQ